MELELELEGLGVCGGHSSVPGRRCFPRGDVTCVRSLGWTGQEGTHRRDSRPQPRFRLWLSGVARSPGSSPDCPLRPGLFGRLSWPLTYSSPLPPCPLFPEQLSFPGRNQQGGEVPVAVRGWAVFCLVFQTLCLDASDGLRIFLWHWPWGADSPMPPPIWGIPRDQQ